MKTIRIAIADDHNLFREGIKALLDDNEQMNIVGEASNGTEIIYLVENEEVDVVLMDINMPGMNGIEATRHISAHHPEVNVLALSMSIEDKHISEMLYAGARGYILKSTGKQELLTAIETLHSKNSYFSREVSERILRQLKEERYQPDRERTTNDSPLTQREIEVLSLIAGEKSNHQIAKELNISIRTVDTHRRNLLQKLHVKNTAGLVKYAFQHKLIPG